MEQYVALFANNEIPGLDVIVCDLQIPYFLFKLSINFHDYVLKMAKVYASRWESAINITDIRVNDNTLQLFYEAPKPIKEQDLIKGVQHWLKRWTKLPGSKLCKAILCAILTYVYKKDSEVWKHLVIAYMQNNLQLDSITDLYGYFDAEWRYTQFHDTFFWDLGDTGWDCVCECALRADIELDMFSISD